MKVLHPFLILHSHIVDGSKANKHMNCYSTSTHLVPSRSLWRTLVETRDYQKFLSRIELKEFHWQLRHAQNFREPLKAKNISDWICKNVRAGNVSFWQVARKKHCFMRSIRQKAEKEKEREVEKRGKEKIRD